MYGYQIQHTFNFIQVLGASSLSSVALCSDPAYVITSSDTQNKLVSCNLTFYINQCSLPSSQILNFVFQKFLIGLEISDKNLIFLKMQYCC